MIVTLRDCPENTKCELIDSDIPDSLKSRLMGLGWLPGKTIQVVRRAPMGDPTIFMVDSTKIFLREEESRMIKVKPIYPAPLAVAGRGIYKITGFLAGGPRFVERARSSGLFVGGIIEVISNPLKGKMMIATKNGEVAIGRGFSEKVFVEPIKR
ncbi:FeoA domain-containing protein [Mesoaciditoga sp.]